MKKYMLHYKNPSTENWTTMTPESMKPLLDSHPHLMTPGVGTDADGRLTAQA